MNTNAIPYWDTLVRWNESLIGAPAGLLIFILCIACGYVWKMVRVLPNRFIPLVVMLTGALLYPLLMWTKEGPPVPVIVRNSILGFIVGFAAWLFHRLLLKRIEDKFGAKLDEDEQEQQLVIPKDNYDPKKD